MLLLLLLLLIFMEYSFLWISWVDQLNPKLRCQQSQVSITVHV